MHSGFSWDSEKITEPIKIYNGYSVTMNLQFFAKDGPGGEKTEEPTAKKLEDARKEGQVAKSKDLSSSILLFASLITLRVYISFLGERFTKSFYKNFTRIGELYDSSFGEINISYVVALLRDNAFDMLLMVLPIFLIGFLLGIIVDLVQVKWKPTAKPLMPKFSKFNPVNGIKRLFSTKTLVQLIKQILIIVVIVLVIYNKIKDKAIYIYGLYDVSLTTAILFLGDTIFDIGILICAIYVVIGFADFVYEKRKFKKDMMMTKQEVKEEWKNTEGSPEVKQKQRQKMQEVSRRRMMQAVPEADVVITNPTHFAVALKYEREQGKAPVVVAKGEDYLAAKIKEVAKENNVEIVENKPLARMLYYNVDLNQEIPQELYQAVAEVLAFVYGLKNQN